MDGSVEFDSDLIFFALVAVRSLSLGNLINFFSLCVVHNFRCLLD